MCIMVTIWVKKEGRRINMYVFILIYAMVAVAQEVFIRSTCRDRGRREGLITFH